MNANFNKTGLLFLLALSFSNTVFAQRMICKNGTTSFFSETPMENISALNKQITSLIDIPTKAIAVKMQMSDFDFPNKLMQEHFNENYMESEKFPTAVFSGKINENIDFTKPGNYPITATGQLIMHGVKQERTLKGNLIITPEKLALDCSFDVKLADHKIDIPTIVIAKIAENVNVKSHFEYLNSGK